MAIAINLPYNNVDSSANNFVYAAGTLAFSGSYATGGDTLDFSAVADRIASSQPPLQLSISSQNGAFNQYVPVQGSALNNWKVKVASPGGTELAAGAYPAGVTSDIVTFQAIFRKLL